MVGPRPERPFFVEKFKEEIPRYMIKHQVRPGLTGWAQINGRDDIGISEKAELDYEYLRRESFFFDMKCFFLTIRAVIIGEGAR
jgi:lipopolysaccharide/colanic/teichoic acid biosynthesis glycosyltransferase